VLRFEPVTANRTLIFPFKRLTFEIHWLNTAFSELEAPLTYGELG
jgi:hypothetical protein